MLELNRDSGDAENWYFGWIEKHLEPEAWTEHSGDDEEDVREEDVVAWLQLESSVPVFDDLR